MSSAAIANGGGVATGSSVAILQSVGAAGLGLAGSAAVGTTGAVVGGATTAAVSSRTVLDGAGKVATWSWMAMPSWRRTPLHEAEHQVEKHLQSKL